MDAEVGRRLGWGALVAVLALTPGCDRNRGSRPNARLLIRIVPEVVTVPTGGRISFEALRAGLPDPGLTWRLREPKGGALLPGGTFLASSRPGTYHLQALDNRSGEKAEATITVVPDPGDGLMASSAEVYDPIAVRVESVGRTRYGRIGSGACRLQDGRVLVVGGRETPQGRDLASAECYNPTTRAFEPSLATLFEPRSNCSLTLLRDGRVLVLGGGRTPGSAELYDPELDRFHNGGMCSAASGHHRTLLLLDGRVLVAGEELALFDPETQVSVPLPLETPVAKDRSLTLLSDGNVLLAGGLTAEEEPVGDVLMLEVQAERLVRVGTMAQPRGRHAAHPLSGDAVLFFGGKCAGPPPGEEIPPDGIEEWSLSRAQGTVRYTCSQPFPDAPFIQLKDGRVVGIGSLDPKEGSRDVTLLVPLGGAVRPLLGLANGRTGHAMAQLGDGRILVVGGFEQVEGLRGRRKPGARS